MFLLLSFVEHIICSYRLRSCDPL